MRTQNNYFTMPNEVFQLGLSAGELAVYSYLRRCEDRRTHQCWPSYRTIGSAVGMNENTVRKYVLALEERGLIVTEPTDVRLKSGRRRNGNLKYTLPSIQEVLRDYYARQRSTLEALLAHITRVAGHIMNTLNAGNNIHTAQQLSESVLVAKILAIGINVLSQQSKFLVAIFNCYLNLGNNIIDAAAALASAYIRHDAVGTEIIAAIHNRNPGSKRALAYGAG